jgi:hypothetical protein
MHFRKMSLQVNARATVFWHVTLQRDSSVPRLLHWDDNFEYLIVAFYGDLQRFSSFIQRHSKAL